MKMSLSAVTNGIQKSPITALVYGVEGIGKTSFGAGAPKPVFIDAERGSGCLDVARFPTPESWQDVLDAVNELAKEDHDYKTLVIDTIDWLEPLIFAHVCKVGQKDNIEDFGFGKGYVIASDQWRIALAALEGLRSKRGMNVVLLAHTGMKKFQNPMGDDYDRYELKLQNRSVGIVKEWPQCVMFAAYETVVMKDDKTKRVRGVDTGNRLLYTQRTAAFDAKNRFSLPSTVELDWGVFTRAIDDARGPDSETMKSEINRLASVIGGDIATKALAALEKAESQEKVKKVYMWIKSKEIKP